MRSALVGEWRQQDSAAGVGGREWSYDAVSTKASAQITGVPQQGWLFLVVLLEARGPGLYASSSISHWMWATPGHGCELAWVRFLWLTAVLRWGLSWKLSASNTQLLGDGCVHPGVEGLGSIQYTAFLYGMLICLFESYSYKYVFILKGYSFAMCFCFV